MSEIEHPSDQYNAVLPVGTTYVGIGGDSALIHSVHMKWDAVLVAAITVESSNLPEVAINSVVAGDWIAETAPGTTSPAAAAGGALLHIGNNGAKRLRLKCVASAAGVLRVRQHGKF